MFYIYIDESGIGKNDGKTSIALVYLRVEDVAKLDGDRVFPLGACWMECQKTIH